MAESELGPHCSVGESLEAVVGGELRIGTRSGFAASRDTKRPAAMCAGPLPPSLRSGQALQGSNLDAEIQWT